MGLVRLQRALGGAIPPFDPIGSWTGAGTTLGDKDTGTVATRDALPRVRDGIQPVPGAARKGRTRAAQVGDTAPGETQASLGGETWTRRYSGAQAAEIVGQLKPVTAPFEGAARRPSASAGGHSPSVSKAGSETVSKGGALEPRPPEICDERAPGPNRPREALAYWSARDPWITWEGLRAAGVVPGNGLWLGAS